MYSVCLFVFSNGWLAVPYVTKLCKNFHELYEVLKNEEDVDNIIIVCLTEYPHEKDENIIFYLKKNLQKSLTRLLKLVKSSKYFFILYLIQNLLLFCIVIAYFIITEIQLELNKSVLFTCDLKEYETMLPKNYTTNFTCFYQFRHKTTFSYVHVQ